MTANSGLANLRRRGLTVLSSNKKKGNVKKEDYLSKAIYQNFSNNSLLSMTLNFIFFNQLFSNQKSCKKIFSL